MKIEKLNAWFLVCDFLTSNICFTTENEESQKDNSETSQNNEQSFFENLIEFIADNAIQNPDYGKDISDR